MAEEKFHLTSQQEEAIEAMKAFTESTEDKVFILTGYAGTGKTTLIRAYTKWLVSKGYVNRVRTDKNTKRAKIFVPMASTGRAAKILRDKTEQAASTVHSAIYYYSGFNQNLEKMVQTIDENKGVDNTGDLFLTFSFEPIEDENHTVYIIDEASMLSNQGGAGSIFGTGLLLDDLIHYAYEAEGCRILFVGDVAQLPPVGEALSPALNADVLRGYGLSVAEADLTEVVRQAEGSDVLAAATHLRCLLSEDTRLWTLWNC